MPSSWAAPGEEASAALALVNTLLAGPSGPVDLLEAPGRAGRWLGGPSSGEAFRRLKVLRAAVRDVFEALADGLTPDPASVQTVNGFAARAPSAPALVWPAGSGPRAEERPSRGSAEDVALGRVAADAIRTVTGPLAGDLHRCEARGCVRLLIKDHPRRRWCSTRCGNRMRAAEHYARRIRR